LERAHRELVVRGHEDDRHLTSDELQHLEAIELRHLNVEQDQLRLQLSDRLDGLEAVGAFRRDLDVTAREQMLLEHLPRQHLVVDDHDTKRRIGHEVTSEEEAAATAAGASGGGGGPGSSSSTRNRSRSASTRKLPSRPYAMSRRRCTFISPMPAPLFLRLAVGSRGLSTTIARCCSIRCALSRTVPPSTRSAMPCVTAFSTSGWSSSGG